MPWQIIVTEDGFVDLNNPERVEAYVGPPDALISLDVEDKRINIDCHSAGTYPDHLIYRRTLRIVGELGDMNEWLIRDQRTAKECGSAVVLEMFKLRTGKHEEPKE